MNIKENTKSEFDEDIPFEKITFDADYKIKKLVDEPLMDVELKLLPYHLEYAFLEEPSFLHVIISSQLPKQNKNKLISVLKRHKQAFAWKTTDIPGNRPRRCRKIPDIVALPNLLRVSLRRLRSDAITNFLTLSLVGSDDVARNCDDVSRHCTYILETTSCKVEILSHFFLN
ncbi:hypothetical protein Tco_1401143 [Tanacetum coccineum]